MKILVVGAGAVGQVYGHHLALGGAQVSFFVRSPRRETAARGVALTRITPFGRRHTLTFAPAHVVTSTDEVKALRPDQIWFCVPTTSLDPALLKSLAAASPNATLVVLSPGHFVRRAVVSAVGERRAVFGEIGMMSYRSPLDGSDDPRETATPEGIAYLLSTTKLSSASDRRALEARSALQHGGVPAVVTTDVVTELAFATASLMPFLAGLELAGWSFETFRASPFVDLATRAMSEAVAITSAQTGRPAPLFVHAAQPFALRLGTRILPRFAPLDIEGFLRVHFTKVAEQTALLLLTLLEDANTLGLPCDALRELTRALQSHRSTAQGADR